VTLDFPGYGLSPEASADLEVADMADLVESFVEALDLDDYTLVVHDLGGPLGLVAASRDPERVAGLVLSQTFAWTPDKAALRAMFRIVGSRPFTALDRATNLIPRMSAGKSGVGKHLDEAGRRAFLGPFQDHGVRGRFHTTMRSAFRDRSLTDAAEQAATRIFRERPVLTIFGEKNDPFGFQARHAEVFPDHEGVVVEGGNHFPMMDDPDLFAASLREWHGSRLGAYRPPAAPESIGQPTSVR
ncbi:MAG: alpha/beta fold hydrolase, partial [Miltoncostaeaceae bacterium]